MCVQLVDVTEGFLSLMTDDGDTRDDIKVPEGDIGKEIKDKFEGVTDQSFLVTILAACGQEAAIAIKNMPK